jgi:hypothetical protein
MYEKEARLPGRGGSASDILLGRFSRALELAGRRVREIVLLPLRRVAIGFELIFIF